MSQSHRRPLVPPLPAVTVCKASRSATAQLGRGRGGEEGREESSGLARSDRDRGRRGREGRGSSSVGEGKDSLLSGC